MSIQNPPYSSDRPIWLVIAIVSSVMLLPSAGCVGWCLYDAQVTYPQRIQRWQAYEQIQQQHGPDAQLVWEKHAQAKGWPTETPERYTKHIILTQYILGGICSGFGVVAIVFAVVGFRLNRRRV